MKRMFMYDKITKPRPQWNLKYDQSIDNYRFTKITKKLHPLHTKIIVYTLAEALSFLASVFRDVSPPISILHATMQLGAISE